jgi:hypothetical protein
MIIKSKSDLAKCSELLSTIYHEAGHTIYGLLHFIKIETVYVSEDKTSKRIEGFTHYNFSTLENIKDPILLLNRINAEIGLFYAGLAAEKYYFKIASGSDKFPLFLRDGSSYDTYSVSNIIKKYNLAPPGRKRYDFKKKIIKDANQELQNNWEAVILVAHALFKKKKLCFLEIKTLLTKKSKNKEFWRNQFKIINYCCDNEHTLDEKDLKCMIGI